MTFTTVGAREKRTKKNKRTVVSPSNDCPRHCLGTLRLRSAIPSRSLYYTISDVSSSSAVNYSVVNSHATITTNRRRYRFVLCACKRVGYGSDGARASARCCAYGRRLHVQPHTKPFRNNYNIITIIWCHRRERK